MTARDRSAVTLLSRWRNLVDGASAALDPTSPAAARVLSALVELADDTDRFLDDVTDEIEASA